MKIVRATIYGFAKWHDFSFDFHPNELDIIFGDNESGKSSVQQFILFILFGLPPKKREFYRSKTSGKMGGMLTVYEEEIGEFSIERVDEMNNGAAKCLLPNGEQQDEKWLKGQLQGLDRQTFQSIFSFDSIDLTTIKTMNETDFGDILLGIGMTGSSNITMVEKRLDSELNELFKPFGKKPLINQQLNHLDDLHNKVEHFKQHAQTYRQKKESVSTLNLEIENLQTSIQKHRKQLLENEKVQQALPNIYKLKQINTKLKDYPSTIFFPEEGMKRWEVSKEKSLPLESELAVLQHNLSSYRSKHTELQSSLMDMEQYHKLKEILDTRNTYYQYKKEIERLEKSYKEQEISLDNELRTLDTQLSRNELSEVTLTYQTETTWKQLNDENQRLETEKDYLDQEEVVLQRQEEEFDQMLTSLQEKILPSNQIDELSNRIRNYNYAHLHANETQQFTSFNTIKKQKRKAAQNRFIGATILGVFFALLGLIQNYSWIYGLSITLIGIGIVQWFLTIQSLKSMEQLINVRPLESTKVSLDEKEEAELLLEEHDNRMRKIETIKEKLQSLTIEQIKWQERKNLYNQKTKRLSEKVNQQSEFYPFLRKVAINNWPSYYFSLKSLLEKNNELKRVNLQLCQIKNEVSTIRSTIFAFFEDNNRELQNKSTDHCYELLQEKLDDYNDTFAQIKQYKNWINETNDQISAMKQKLHVFQSEQLNLLQAAKVETEEQYYYQHTLQSEKQDFETKKAELLDQLMTLFSEEKIEMFVSDNMLEIGRLQEEQKNYSDKLKYVEKELEAKRTERAELNATLAGMESSAEHSEVMHRYYLETAELKKLADKWAVLKSAKELLEETKRNYREKYMTRIIEQTADYFSILTNHTYLNVYAPNGDQPFQVESSNRLRFTVNELSQGTKDQLYIALRFAVSEVMNGTRQMPFIIDDAFVHFDSVRVENMMQLLESVAKNRQVILFTCKKELVEHREASSITVLSRLNVQ